MVIPPPRPVAHRPEYHKEWTTETYPHVATNVLEGIKNPLEELTAPVNSIVLTEENFSEFIEVVNHNFKDNMTFVEDFLDKAQNDNLDKESMLKMLELLNISDDLDVSELEKFNQENDIYSLIDNQRENSNSRVQRTYCDKLVEIRDAMLDECDRYVIGLDETCGAAVMMAYWWKSRDC